MGKQRTGSVLTKLLGKKVVFQGKFDYGAQETLTGMAEAQQCAIAEELDATIDYLVLADLNGGKTVQKKAATLNGKGASIQVMDAAAFKTLVEPTSDEVLSLLYAGRKGAVQLGKMTGHSYRYYHVQQAPQYIFVNEPFKALGLEGFDFTSIKFDQCNFAQATMEKVQFGDALNCDFSGVKGASTTFGDIEGSKFLKATLSSAQFQGHIANTDFTDGVLDSAVFSRYLNRLTGPRQVATAGTVFERAKLVDTSFHGVSLQTARFNGADLLRAKFHECWLDSADFRGAVLQNASMTQCHLSGANFAGADLQGANLAGADLTNAILDGANLAGCNLRGAKLGGVDLSKAKNYDPNAQQGGAVGPALTELDQVAQQAKRIQISFNVGTSAAGDTVGLDTNGLKHGWGLHLPISLGGRYQLHQAGQTLSSALLHVANLLGHQKILYGTTDVSTTKSPKGGKELRELVLKGIAEAFGQVLPPEEELAAATKAWREKTQTKQTVNKEEREKAIAAAAKAKVAETKKIEKTIAKQVGKVTDVATFLKALELRIEKPKIDKATKMLKASGFQLFNDVGDTHLYGVVKSQTDPDLVYACRVDSEGHYACCTQNLNICGGLRGSICKHLLVLIIGLVQAGTLDPTTIDDWVSKTRTIKAELDKEKMGDIFIRYKGAEAGEVDWRPTETVPEDYYTL